MTKIKTIRQFGILNKVVPRLFQRIGSSIDIDKRLYKEDIKASIVHVEMLFKQKIISFKIKNKIIYGLNKIEKEISKNKFEFKRVRKYTYEYRKKIISNYWG